MKEQLILEPHPNNLKSRVRILTGVDDGATYRVVIPMRIKTVEDALEWLRPPNVPPAALRQGEFYFIPSNGPHAAAGCDHKFYDRCGSEEYTDAGSRYIWSVHPAEFSQTHEATEGLAVQKSGSVCFLGRKKIKSHDFTARPQYFVTGCVHHEQHGDLELPGHGEGDWYEVIPNRAHGPFPVRGFGRGD